MIAVSNFELAHACCVLSIGFLFVTLLVFAFATYKQRQTRQLLEKAGLPTKLWTPRFVNYQLRTSISPSSNNELQPTERDKKLASSTITNILPRMERLGGPFGMYGTVYGISTPVIHVAHPTPARAILSGDAADRLPLSSTSGATKSPAYNHFKNFSGDGVFTADGDTWKDKRASVMHSLFRSCGSGGGQAFHQQLEVEANHAADIFIQQVESRTTVLSKSSDVARINVVPMLQRATIGLIYRYLTHDKETARNFIESSDVTNKNETHSTANYNTVSNNGDLKKQERPESTKFGKHWTLSLDEYLESITNIRMILLAQSRSIWYLLPRWCYRYGSSMYQEEERTLLPIREFACMACHNAKPCSPLARLMSRESHSNSKDMLDEAITLLFAGQDTSAATLSWTIHLLSLYPDIQHKLAAEVALALSSKQSSSTADADDKCFVSKSLFSSMPYLDAVIKEGMRLYPVAPFVVRKLSHDVPVVGGFGKSNQTVTLPAGAVACIWIYGLHRNPSLWDRPDDFVPERWLANNSMLVVDPSLTIERQQQSHPVCHEAYMPFALGPRNCVGQPMAQVILRILLARLVWQYQFCDERLSNDGSNAKILQKEMQAGFTVLPLGGVHVAIHPRRNAKQHKERLE